MPLLDWRANTLTVFRPFPVRTKYSYPFWRGVMPLLLGLAHSGLVAARYFVISFAKSKSNTYFGGMAAN